MDMLISLLEVIITQWIHVSNRHVAHLKHILFLFANHTSIKQEKISFEVSNPCM